MKPHIEQAFAPELIRRASLRGGEYAWPLNTIPEVIEAARAADLISIGGQLQFRLPNGGTCECYWVEVNTYREVDKTLPWETRVQLTADVASRQFSKLPPGEVLADEGWKAFPSHLAEAENSGSSAADLMCFVWYVADRHDGA